VWEDRSIAACARKILGLRLSTTTVGAMLGLAFTGPPIGLAGVHVHFHRFHGPPFDYLGLALGAAASWIIGIGPGEVLLVAAAVLAAKHKLDLTEVVLIAWIGAMCGGIISWLIGRQAGNAMLSERGPFPRARRNAIARGERVFKRQVVFAVILTAGWVAGVLRVRWSVFLPANALSAGIWALGIGLCAFLVGPPLADAFSDLGAVGLVILCTAIVVAGVAEIVRRRTRAG
jgi:membrane protein DedA with SNARE-associated domain